MSTEPGSVHATPRAPLAPRNAWLFGRWTDLLLGSGLAYILSIPVLLSVTETTGTQSWPAVAILLMALLANSPHYGATLVRVYDARQDRRKYAVFAVYLTIALALLLFASTRITWISSALLTAYVTWAPWHFSGQNYGLCLTFLRRRGIAIDAATKRLVYASFVLSALLAIVAIHSGNDEFVLAADTLAVANTPHIRHFPLPTTLEQLVLPILALAYLGCLVVAIRRLGRRAALRELVPAGILVLTQALWFTIPAIAIDWDSARGSSLIFAAVWVSTAHSVQYLWVTAYYARSSQPGTPVARFLLKSFLAGTAVTVLPAVLLAPDLFGGLPWDAGLAATIFAAVNIHHFVLDGAIWKLRDGRVARILLRPQDRAASLPEPIDAPRPRPWLRPLVWTTVALAVPIHAAQIWAERTIGGEHRAGRIESAFEVLRWSGRERVETRFSIGRRLAAAGDVSGAIEQFQRSIELFPTARVWGALGAQYRAQGRWDLALDAFDRALELNPEFQGAHYRRAEALVALAGAQADPATRAEARASLERALEISPGFAEAALMLADLQVVSGDRDAAMRTLNRTLKDAEGAGASTIRRRLRELEREASL
jgi:hypothetical protein